eukprot:gene10577-3096_t
MNPETKLTLTVVEKNDELQENDKSMAKILLGAGKTQGKCAGVLEVEFKENKKISKTVKIVGISATKENSFENDTGFEVIVASSEPRNCQLSFVEGCYVDINHDDDIAGYFSKILAGINSEEEFKKIEQDNFESCWHYFSQEKYQLWNFNIQNKDKKHQSEYIKASNELISYLKKFDGKDASVFLKLLNDSKNYCKYVVVCLSNIDPEIFNKIDSLKKRFKENEDEIVSELKKFLAEYKIDQLKKDAVQNFFDCDHMHIPTDKKEDLDFAHSIYKMNYKGKIFVQKWKAFLNKKLNEKKEALKKIASQFCPEKIEIILTKYEVLEKIQRYDQIISALERISQIVNIKRDIKENRITKVEVKTIVQDLFNLEKYFFFCRVYVTEKVFPTKILDSFAKCAEDNCIQCLFSYMKENKKFKSQIASIKWSAMENPNQKKGMDPIVKKLCPICSLRFIEKLENMLECFE